MLMALFAACEQPPAPTQTLKISQTIKVSSPSPGPTEPTTPAAAQTPKVSTPTLGPTLDGAQAAFDAQNPDRAGQVAISDIVFSPVGQVWVAIGGFVDAERQDQAIMYVDASQNNSWQTLSTLELNSQSLGYLLAGETVYLWDNSLLSFVGITLDQPIASVEVRGNALALTLEDGNTRTFVKDKETRQWQEQVLKVYREFELKELTAENYQTQINIALTGGMFINTKAEWQELQEQGWQVVEDVSSHAPVLVSPEVAGVIVQEYSGNFGASPWAKIFNETRGSTLEGKFKIRSDAPAVATFDSQSRPILTVSLAEFNPLGDNKVAIILTGESKRIDVPWAFEQKWHFRDMIARWDPVVNKLALVDEYETATHEWDDQKGEWVELDEYRVYGSPEERVAFALEYKLNEVRRVDSKNHENPLGLNPEIVAEAVRLLEEGKPVDEINQELMRLYEEKQKEDPKSSGIWLAAGADGEPYMVAVVGGEYGLTFEQLANLQKAVAGLEAVDPGIMKFLSEQFGAKFVSRYDRLSTEADGGTFSSNNYRETIFAKSKSVRSVPDFIFVLLVESGEIHVGRHMTSEGKFANKMSEYNNVGVFAMKWAIDWLKLHGDGLIQNGVITQKELNDIVNLAKYNLEQYQNSP